jgi:hypothetical protein
MAKPIKTPFKDAQFPPSSGAPDLELEGYSASQIQGDMEINGHKVVIGLGLEDCIKDPS